MDSTYSNVPQNVAARSLIHANGGPTSDKEEEDFLREIKILSALNHSNIVRVLGFTTNLSSFPNEDGTEQQIGGHSLSDFSRRLTAIFEYSKRGDLYNFLRQNHQRISQDKLVDICGQIAVGMAYLEEKGVVHKDLAVR